VSFEQAIASLHRVDAEVQFPGRATCAGFVHLSEDEADRDDVVVRLIERRGRCGRVLRGSRRRRQSVGRRSDQAAVRIRRNGDDLKCCGLGAGERSAWSEWWESSHRCGST